MKRALPILLTALLLTRFLPWLVVLHAATATFVKAVATATSSALTCVVSITPTAGNMLYVWSTEVNDHTATIADTQLNTFVEIAGGRQVSGTALSADHWYVQSAASGAADTITVTWSATANNTCGVMEVSGVANPALDVQNYGQDTAMTACGSGNSANCTGTASAGLAQADEIVLSYAAEVANVTALAATDGATVPAVTNNPANKGAMSYKNVLSAGGVIASWSWTTSSRAIVAVATFKSSTSAAVKCHRALVGIGC